MILTVHDKRNWLVDKAPSWVEGAHIPGLTIYNDPPEIIFRKNDSDSRKDLVITLEYGHWIARFKDGSIRELERE